MDRRELLALLGGSLAAGLAGCLGDDDEQDDPPDGGAGADDSGSDDDADGDDTPTDENGSTDDDASADDTGTDGENGTDDSGGGANGDDGNDNVPGQPLSTVESYVAAIDAGDEQGAVALLHEDSDLTAGDVQRDIEFFGGADVTLAERGLVDFEEGVLTARGILSVEREGEDPSRIGLELQLRQTSTGQWLIVDGRATRLDSGDGSQSDDETGDNETDG